MKLVLIAWLMVAIQACDGEEERPEVLNKLRALGATTAPLVATPSPSVDAPTQVTVTVHVAVPEGQEVEIAPFEDEPTAFAANLSVADIAVQNGTIQYATYPGFRLLSFQALLNVPTAARFVRTGGGGQARYGFKVSAGGEEEKIVGNFLVYPGDAPEAAWTQPEIAVLSPGDGAVLGSGSDVELSASITDKNDEDLKVGWFVSDGEIRNRRARSTIWKAPGPGAHTVIFTARGKKSRAFVIQPLTVTVQ